MIPAEVQLLAHPPIADTAEERALERVEHHMDVEMAVTGLWVAAALENACAFLRGRDRKDNVEPVIMTEYKLFLPQVLPHPLIKGQVEPGDTGVAVRHLGSHLQVWAVKHHISVIMDLARGRGARRETLTVVGRQHSEPDGDLGAGHPVPEGHDPHREHTLSVIPSPSISPVGQPTAACRHRVQRRPQWLAAATTAAPLCSAALCSQPQCRTSAIHGAAPTLHHPQHSPQALV